MTFNYAAGKQLWLELATHRDTLGHVSPDNVVHLVTDEIADLIAAQEQAEDEAKMAEEDFHGHSLTIVVLRL